MSRASLDALTALPRDADGPVFTAPWQAQAFAMAVRLSEQGAFTWDEWTRALGREIAHAEGVVADHGEAYYRHWLSALENLVVEKDLANRAALNARREAWARAAEAAPHGEPILLDAAARAASSGF